MAKTGRPKRIVVTAEVKDRIANLASIGMKVNEISTLVGLTEVTLQRKFGNVLRKKRLEAKEAVVRRQFEGACNGVVPFSIWWGKNYGEQSDRADVTSGGDYSGLARFSGRNPTPQRAHRCEISVEKSH